MNDFLVLADELDERIKPLLRKLADRGLFIDAGCLARYAEKFTDRLRFCAEVPPSLRTKTREGHWHVPTDESPAA